MEAPKEVARGDDWYLEELPDHQHRLSFRTGEIQDRTIRRIVTPGEAHELMSDGSRAEAIVRRYLPWSPDYVGDERTD